MRTLILGGAGFLGRSFLRHHLAAGDSVTAVDDLSSAGAYWPKGGYRRIEDDAAAVLGHWGVHPEGFDVAYQFAAPVGGRTKIEGDPLYNADSLRLDAAFFRWAPGNVKRAVYPSSSAVYPVTAQVEDGMPLREDMFDPEAGAWGAPDEMYGFTKLAGEVLASKAAKYGLDTLVLRPFSGYGEEQSFDYPIPSICRRVVNREDPLVIWGSGHQRRDLIHVDDIVAATTIIAANPNVTGAYPVNLGSGVPLSFIDIARIAAGIEGYRPEIVTDESKPVGVSSRYANIARMFNHYSPRITPEEGLRRVMDSIRGRKEVSA